MKTYPTVDLTGDRYLNPIPAVYDNGLHIRNVNQIKSISIHHDAVPRPHDYDSVDRYRNEAAAHYNRLGPGLQYHYKIDNTGTIFHVRPLTTWLYAVGSAENVTMIAICLDGYLHDDGTGQAQDPTREQGEALFQLLTELCENHPEFPATWPNVRPHADYQSTACCGSRLKGHIYPIQDKATAKAQLLNQWSYDWPSEQPNTPAPKPTDPVPTPPTVTINYRVIGADGKQLGAYSVDKNAWQKYQDSPGSHINDSTGADVTELLRVKFAPPAPPTPPTQSHDDVQDARLSALEAIISAIKALFAKIGINF